MKRFNRIQEFGGIAYLGYPVENGLSQGKIEQMIRDFLIGIEEEE